MNTNRSFLHTCVFSSSLLIAASAGAATYDALYVLGDSLSDVGNRLQTDMTVTVPPFDQAVPDSPYAYGGGRYSNGPVWVEYLAAYYGQTLTPSEIGTGNGYAYGSARSGALPGVADSGVPTVIEQAGELLADAGTLGAQALIVIWAGGNDVRDAGALAAGGNFAAAGAILAASLNNIGTTISMLAAHGGQNFLIPNLPDLSLTPAAIAAGPAFQSGAQQLSLAFNTGMELLLPQLGTGLEIHIEMLDVFALILQVTQDPAQFGFTDITTGCAFANGGQGCVHPQQYAFWDAIHPTTRLHEVLAHSAVPLPPALWLIGSAIAGLTVLGRRNGAASCAA